MLAFALSRLQLGISSMQIDDPERGFTYKVRIAGVRFHRPPFHDLTDPFHDCHDRPTHSTIHPPTHPPNHPPAPLDRLFGPPALNVFKADGPLDMRMGGEADPQKRETAAQLLKRIQREELEVGGTLHLPGCEGGGGGCSVLMSRHLKVWRVVSFQVLL